MIHNAGTHEFDVVDRRQHADDLGMNRHAAAVGCLGGSVLLAALLTELHFRAALALFAAGT
jgi:hypothetical protein